MDAMDGCDGCRVRPNGLRLEELEERGTPHGGLRLRFAEGIHRPKMDARAEVRQSTGEDG